MAKLYELVGQYLELQKQLEASDFDAETISDTLEAESGDLERKIINTAKLICNIESDAEALKDHAKRQAGRAKAIEATAERMREWLIYNMNTAGIKQIKDLECPVSVRESKTVIMIEGHTIPADMLLPPKPQDPDKRKISEKLKAGEKLPYAQLEIRNSLKIG